MLYALNDLEDFSLRAQDGIIGKIKDFYFDDRQSVVRYIVVEVGTSLASRKILLSPAVIKYLDSADKLLVVDLSLDDIRNSPCVDTNRYVSLQQKFDYLSYYGYAFCWENNSLWDSFAHPVENGGAKNSEAFTAVDSVRRMYGDKYLRSCAEIRGYHIHAKDGEIGCLGNVVFDENNWGINGFIAYTNNLFSNRQLCVSPEVIKDISWGEAKINADITCQQIQNMLSFDLNGSSKKSRSSSYDFNSYNSRYGEHQLGVH